MDFADKASVVAKLLAENKRLKEELAALGVHDAVDLAKKEEVKHMQLSQGAALR